MAGDQRRNMLRHTVRILRRCGGAGGYSPDEYREIAVTSACVRDESDREFDTAEAAGVLHGKTFTMRAREILPDDVIVWHGRDYEVRSVDAIYNDGRWVKVRATLSESRHRVADAHG